MEKEKVDALIRKLNNEIVKVQKGQEQEESLVRLKEIARVYRGEDKVIPFSDVKARIKTSADDFN
jgi:hypothetical protein